MWVVRPQLWMMLRPPSWSPLYSSCWLKVARWICVTCKQLMVKPTLFQVSSSKVSKHTFVGRWKLFDLNNVVCVRFQLSQYLVSHTACFVTFTWPCDVKVPKPGVRGVVVRVEDACFLLDGRANIVGRAEQTAILGETWCDEGAGGLFYTKLQNALLNVGTAIPSSSQEQVERPEASRMARMLQPIVQRVRNFLVPQVQPWIGLYDECKTATRVFVIL